jgi:hypothetical protein
LSAQKLVQGEKFPAVRQARLDAINGVVTNLEKCGSIAGGLDKFLTFRENTAGLITSIKQNIIVLNKYKEFP